MIIDAVNDKMPHNSYFMTVKNLETERKLFRIPTGCPELDNILQGGIESASVTEVFGASGTGRRISI